MANPSPPEAWSAIYEASPGADDGVGQGDDWLRQLKTDIRERGEVEHHHGSISSDDNGLHRVGSARAFVQATAPTVIEQVDHDNTGGLGTATLSATASNSSPVETVGLGRLWVRTIDGALHYYGASGWAEIAPMPRGHLAGLGLDATAPKDLTVAVGEARTGISSNRSMRNGRVGTAITKKIDATWAVGTAVGGMATGAVANNTWYHFFLIVSPTGTVDAGFDTNVEATNLLANAAVIAAGFTVGNTTYRRVGSVKTSAASTDIRDFIQHGDTFVWTTPPGLDESQVAGVYTAGDNNITLEHVPLGIITEAILRVSSAGAVITNALVRSGGTVIGAAPNNQATPLATTDAVNGAVAIRVLTDTSKRVVYRVSSGVSNLFMEVEGYVDARGRWD